MSSLKYILVVFTLLLTTFGHAQSKNLQTEDVKIYGNCGMCESAIEKAGNVKNEAKVDWDKESKMASITYDNLKTSKSEILKRIALAGYDSDAFLAPTDTYNSLPGCCQYERANKESAEMDDHKMASHDMKEHKLASEKIDHSEHGETMTKMENVSPLAAVFNNYFAIKDALVKTDAKTAAEKSKDLLSSINEVKMESLEMDVHMAWMKVLPNLKENAKRIGESTKINKQREYFITLSSNIYEVLKLSKVEDPVYYQFCPMANDGKGANWLSREDEIKNPYYGSQMLTCGKTVETIKKSN